MRDERKQAFGPYLRALADLMGLRDWTVGVDDVPCNDASSHAEIRCVYGRKIAWVRLSEDFLESAAVEQRQVLVHELVHCHFAAMAMMLDEHLAEPMKSAYAMPFEYGVDAVADALAPHLPLPTDADAGGTI